VVFLFITFTALQASSGNAAVKAFFNHNSSSSYTDPYRKISRSGDNLEAVVLNEIKNARKSIFIAVMEFRLPLIAQALVDKHKSGVDVRLIVDNEYNNDITHQRDPGDNEHEASHLNELRAFVDSNRNGRIENKELETRDAIYMLKKAGIKIVDDTAGGGMGSALMHHKFVVVDERVVIVSSANFTMSCIHGDVLTPRSTGNSNSMMVFNSTQMADLFVDQFMEMWSGSFSQRKRYHGPRTMSVEGTRVTVQFSPTPKSKGWNASSNGLIGKTLSQANRSIKAALFVFSDQQLSNIMEPKYNSRVDIGIMIEKMFAFRSYSELLDMFGLELRDDDCIRDPGNHAWKKPIKEGGMANMGPGDVLHHKYGVVDNHEVIMGSHNWTEAANYQNDETLIVVENSGIASAYSREYERVKSNSQIGAPDYLIRKIKDIDNRCSRRR
jgi:phosphatidylserine/phosphatidylglycerophosphate/cardiolipin synthase-like enzyme